MPNQDGTGPDGKGKGTGKSYGPCQGGQGKGTGQGYGPGCGKGRGQGKVNGGYCPRQPPIPTPDPDQTSNKLETSIGLLRRSRCRGLRRRIE